MTQSTERERCRWCGRPFDRVAGPGRPREFCRRSCRQRDYEARRRAADAGLDENQLVVTRDELHRLADALWLISCAADDARTDIADDPSPAGYRLALEHVLAAVDDVSPERR